VCIRNRQLYFERPRFDLEEKCYNVCGKNKKIKCVSRENKASADGADNVIIRWSIYTHTYIYIYTYTYELKISYLHPPPPPSQENPQPDPSARVGCVFIYSAVVTNSSLYSGSNLQVIYGTSPVHNYSEWIFHFLIISETKSRKSVCKQFFSGIIF